MATPPTPRKSPLAQTPPMQPSTTTPSVSGIPPAVAQLATAQQLGSCSRVYQQPSKSQSLGIALVLLVLGLLLCSGGGWLGQSGNLGGFLGYAVAAISIGVFLGFFGGAVMFLSRALHTRGDKVYLYTQGLILTSKSGPEVYRWDQIGGLRDKVVEQKVRTYRVPIHSYSIRRFDGQQAALSNTIPRMAELWSIITQEVNAVLWPRVQSLYQQGKNISFGPLAISQQGISTSKDQLPWDQVKNCTIANGRVVVEKQGQQFRWADIAADEFTNLPLLDRLTKHILVSRR
ncbi:MAG: hypothetical protein J2P37_00600 [Ktedonobacteraceae bacterium]|nr:hypothetical protein [Ktedonobacteraceae bacterium]MBO0793522.1 hypothetical protein [Ktedonobacteraceae bacterium]